MRSLGLIIAGVALAATLTLSHCLLRMAAAFSPMEYSWFIRVGGALLLYALVFLSYSCLLKYFEISALYPVYTALSVIGVALTGMVFFGEHMSAVKLIGAGLLIIGIGLISS